MLWSGPLAADKVTGLWVSGERKQNCSSISFNVKLDYEEQGLQPYITEPLGATLHYRAIRIHTTLQSH